MSATSARLQFDRVWFGPLFGVTFFADGGQTVVLCERDVGAAWVDLALGSTSPRQGQVRVLGADPRTDPEVRRRSVGVAASERLPSAPNVATALKEIAQVRGRGIDAEQVLGALALGDLAGIAPAALGPGELRSVCLALALADEAAELLLLFEPLTDVAGADREAIMTGIARARARGATVVVATSDPATALSLGGERLLLGARPHRLADPPSLGWYVETEDAALLARTLLAAHPGLRLVVDARGLTLRAEEIDVPRAVIAGARQSGATFRALSPLSPPLAVLLAEHGAPRRGRA